MASHGYVWPDGTWHAFEPTNEDLEDMVEALAEERDDAKASAKAVLDLLDKTSADYEKLYDAVKMIFDEYEDAETTMYIPNEILQTLMEAMR